MNVWSVFSAHRSIHTSKTAVPIGKSGFSRATISNVALSNLWILDLSGNDLTGVIRLR